MCVCSTLAAASEFPTGCVCGSGECGLVGGVIVVNIAVTDSVYKVYLLVNKRYEATTPPLRPDRMQLLCISIRLLILFLFN